MTNSIGATASQAWAILKRHARDEIAPLRLQELCRDNDRVSSLVAVYNHHNSSGEMTSTNSLSSENRILLVDLSRQRMTLETLNHLLRLATARNVKKFITRLAWGQNDPCDPIVPLSVRTKQQQSGSAAVAAAAAAQEAARYTAAMNSKKTARFEKPEGGSSDNGSVAAGCRRGRIDATDFNILPSMHLALRCPRSKNLKMYTADGQNALHSIHQEWDRIERLSESIRRGQLSGATGAKFCDIVVVGRGVPCMALRFLYEALCKDETAMTASQMGMSEETTTSRIRRGIAQATAAAGDVAGVGVNVGIGDSGASSIPPARRMKFISSVDPIAAASLISDLDPSTTLVISIALKGNEETGIATRTMKTWLLQSLANSRRPDLVLGKHMMLVTANDRIAAAINKPESVFVVPDHSRCEAFTSFSVATLLPLSIVFGWPIVEAFLAGAHDMDSHFVETNPRHNLPVLLALTDVWNDAFFSSSGRVVSPYTEALASFPAFVGALEAQTCSKSTNNNNNTAAATTATAAAAAAASHATAAATGAGCATVAGTPVSKLTCSAMVIDGGLNSTYDRAFYQSGKVMNSELIMVMNTQVSANTSRVIGVHGMDDVHAAQDALICSFFAHADEMAFGSERPSPLLPVDPFSPSPLSGTSSGAGSGESTSLSPNLDETEICEGNRPSILLLCGKCDAFACGQLIALSEHRAVVKARIWDIDPFTTETGSAIKANRAEKLRDELGNLFTDINAINNDILSGEDYDEGHGKSNDNNKGMNLSTKTILGHYANLTRDQRIYVGK